MLYKCGFGVVLGYLQSMRGVVCGHSRSILGVVLGDLLSLLVMLAV